MSISFTHNSYVLSRYNPNYFAINRTDINVGLGRSQAVCAAIYDSELMCILIELLPVETSEHHAAI
jgi:hypothetical protein